MEPTARLALAGARVRFLLFSTHGTSSLLERASGGQGARGSSFLSR